MLYHYVGNKQIAERIVTTSKGWTVSSPADVHNWIRHSRQIPDQQGRLTATFVIDATGQLRIADRRSEHVACAGGEPVQSAGEITFELVSEQIEVVWITNQSTGYCPKPDSWFAVRKALDVAGIPSPDSFSQEYNFRRCPACGSINLIKDNHYACDICATSLPEEWNCNEQATS